jgi:amino-acid N-acetyltransferase
VEYTIRIAEFEDAATISGLIRANSQELLPRPMGDIVQNIDRFFVCVVQNKVVGTVSWQILPEIGAPTSPSVEIKSLAVQEDFRHSGIGMSLMKKAIDHIKMHHPSQIIALTFAPEFFMKLGFKEEKKEKLMHKLYAGCMNCTKYDSPFTCPETAMVLEL